LSSRRGTPRRKRETRKKPSEYVESDGESRVVYRGGIFSPFLA